MENKLPLSKPLILVILGVIFAITIGGYILFFQSQKRIAQKDHEYELLKSKASQNEEGYNDIQKKYDSAMEKIKQLTKDNEALVQKSRELTLKQDELQTKFDTLTTEHEKLTKELKEKASAPVSSPAATPTTPVPPSGAAEPKSSDAHPVQQLNQPQNANSQSQLPVTPAVTITPPSPPPDPLKTSLKQTSALSAGVALGGKEFRCPTPETVTKNLNSGNWNEGSLSWYVDYTRRPLNEDEPVQKLFKILFDGQSVACYYELSAGDDNAWIVIKGASKDNKLALKETDGWTPCPTKECEATCAKESLGQCHFRVENR